MFGFLYCVCEKTLSTVDSGVNAFKKNFRSSKANLDFTVIFTLKFREGNTQ